MYVAIIDYGSGNLRSAFKAFKQQAVDAGETVSVEVTADPERVRRADRIVLPGVGAFGDCCLGLNSLEGMTEALNEAVVNEGRPFLGICVGMQLMASVGREHGEIEGLGWIDGEVAPIPEKGKSLKIPHIGWNDLVIDIPGHPVLAGINSGDHAYFVHGYHFICDRPADVLTHVEYGNLLAAAVGRDNLFGTQFHPEKSQTLGLRLISNFLKWRP